MIINGKSDVGLVRSENQDAFWYFTPNQESGFAVVCDGMGGANGGSHASSIAINIVKKHIEHASLSDLNKAEKVFLKIIEESNCVISKEGKENPRLNGMGTTMVLALALKNEVLLGNVGDSRGYHITNGGITQITKDHSAVQELVDSGHITIRQAKLHPNKNVITRAIGVDDEVAPDFFKIKVSQGDLILLCSDGLSNMVDENEIQFEISGGSIENLPERLIELANSRGGTDNITIVAIQL